MWLTTNVLMPDCGNSIANTMELPQSGTKPLQYDT